MKVEPALWTFTTMMIQVTMVFVHRKVQTTYMPCDCWGYFYYCHVRALQKKKKKNHLEATVTVNK